MELAFYCAPWKSVLKWVTCHGWNSFCHVNTVVENSFPAVNAN